ncbi:hypothetical protein [Rubinisphaera margarita]|uniref:hypothetical protein n=1 Tax=Rubinisphaera margarita TaxID=2909586 RepID=UPI001EE99BFB|nr:hypothetical protein [Rubinisphaera margarita]MCG6157581.1 hypothetical protein [Rubinisphaera margarita]
MTSTAKVLSVLVCTSVFATLGLTAGYLVTESIPRADGTILLVSYLIAPAVGALAGFVLSISTIRTFDPDGFTPPKN